MKLKWTLPLLAGVLAVGVYSATVLADPAPLQTKILASSPFADLDLHSHAPGGLWRARIKTRGASDLYVVDNTFGPGTSTGWHSHPGPSLIQVVAGTVTNYTGDDRHCTPHSYAKGAGFVDPGGRDVHMLRNEGDVPAETIVVQLIPQGAPRKTEAPRPANCPA